MLQILTSSAAAAPTLALAALGYATACGGDPPAGGGGGAGAHVDNYACEIDADGYCIFTGTPHAVDLAALAEDGSQVVDGDGVRVAPQGKPIQDGYGLAATEAAVTDADELGYVRVFRALAPIRDALMYDIAGVDAARWAELAAVLRDNGIKTESENLDSDRPPDRAYGIDDIYARARDPQGADIHHSVMKFLEESELELKCLWLTLDLTNPEGVDPCVDLR